MASTPQVVATGRQEVEGDAQVTVFEGATRRSRTGDLLITNSLAYLGGVLVRTAETCRGATSHAFAHRAIFRDRPGSGEIGGVGTQTAHKRECADPRVVR